MWDLWCSELFGSNLVKEHCSLFTVHCTINNLTHTKSPMQCTVWVTQVHSGADNPAIALHFRINPISLALTTTLDCNSLSCTVGQSVVCYLSRSQSRYAWVTRKQADQTGALCWALNKPTNGLEAVGELLKRWLRGRWWCSGVESEEHHYCQMSHWQTMVFWKENWPMQQTVCPKSRKNQEIDCRKFWQQISHVT